MKNSTYIEAVINLKEVALESLDLLCPQETNKKSEAEMNILIAYHEALRYTTKILDAEASK